MFWNYFLPSGDKASFSIIRTIFWLLLVYYALRFFSFGINDEVMDNFIHWPNLIFHEAWHVIFSFFGPFMMILWGSLFQCLLPLFLTYIFLIREEDPFAASITLWWLGQNLTDVALYISDAWARALPLIGGMSEEAHDWWNLLTMMDMIEYDFTFWIMTHYIGMCIMLMALLWWGYIIWYTYLPPKND